VQYYGGATILAPACVLFEGKKAPAEEDMLRLMSDDLLLRYV
jgi:hypothetical protein